MQPKSAESRSLTRLALSIELGLGILAVVIAYLIGQWPIHGLRLLDGTSIDNFRAVGIGVLAVLPMFVMLLVIERLPWSPLLRLRRVVDELLLPLFRGSSIAGLALISISAGIGEELFFRGLMQIAITDAIGSPYRVIIGLTVSSVAFGLCHWVTPTYAVLATLIGMYLGWLYVATDNLLVPITTHAVYDFVALLYLLRKSRVLPDDSERVDEAPTAGPTGLDNVSAAATSTADPEGVQQDVVQQEGVHEERAHAGDTPEEGARDASSKTDGSAGRDGTSST